MHFFHAVHGFFFSIFFTINVGIGTYFVYLYWYLKKKMLLVLSLVVVSKQRFNNINGRSQTNRDKKIEPITFTATWSISKILNQTC